MFIPFFRDALIRSLLTIYGGFLKWGPMCIILWELEITKRPVLAATSQIPLARLYELYAPPKKTQRRQMRARRGLGPRVAWSKVEENPKKKDVLMGKSSINDGSFARFLTLKNKNIWIELEQQCFSLAIEKGNLESEDHVIMPKHDLRPWNSWASLISSFEVAARWYPSSIAELV